LFAAAVDQKKGEVRTWLKDLGIGHGGEEMLREYIGEDGGIQDIQELDNDDVQELGAVQIQADTISLLDVHLAVSLFALFAPPPHPPFSLSFWLSLWLSLWLSC